jgi:prepilin-type N-terminal cleavage/methylation domain-containing protein/prepilin-type processing-associated H-X9-DG protein
MTRSGYTLVEVLVVIGILSVLIGITLPAVQEVRGVAARTSCQDRMRQIGIGFHNHHSIHNRFPANGGSWQSPLRTATPAQVLSWMVNLLPEMDEGILYQQAAAACRIEPMAHKIPPHTPAQSVVRAYICPADQRLTQPLTTPGGRTVAFTSFIGVAGSAIGRGITLLPDGSFRYAPGVFDSGQSASMAEIADGTSNTIAVAERPPPASLQAGEWYQSGWMKEQFGGPNGTMYYFQPPVIFDDPCPASLYGPGRLENPCDRNHFWSLHRGGANFLFADGSVRFIGHSARDIVPALSTRAAGEVVK